MTRGGLLLAALAGLLLVGAAQAQPPKGQRFGDWGVGCETPPGSAEKCFVQQGQVLKDGKRILNLVIGPLGPNGATMMVATFPLGINLPAGAAFRLDDLPPQPIKILQCVPDGCIGTITLDEATLGHLRSGKALSFAMLPFGADKTVAVSASLNGLGPALDALTQ